MKESLDFDDVDLLLRQLAMFRKAFNQLMKATEKKEMKDLSLLQLHLLNTIDANVPCNQKEIAQEVHVSKATLSVRLDKLVNIGLITRVVDENDKRNYILELTPLGKEKMLKGREIMSSSLFPVLKDFTQEDVGIIVDYLSRLKENIEFVKEEL